MKVGKAIKELRNEKGISQNKLSNMATLNRGYLYKLENDLISPSIDMLEKIACIIEVNVSDIILRAEKNK